MVDIKSGQGGCLSGPFDVNKIKEVLPHRYPMLLVDRILEVNTHNKSAIGLKNVSINEAQFQGHFPGSPILPGVMSLEALGQTAAFYALITRDLSDKLVYFMAIDGARFRHPIVPGDQVELHVQLAKERGAVSRYKGKAMVDGKVAVEAELTAMLLDKKDAR